MRPAQPLLLEVADIAEVDVVVRKAEFSFKLRPIEQALARQLLEADQERIACERRDGGVWRIALGGRHERHDLPEMLPGGRHPIEESVGAVAKIPNAMRPGKRGRMRQNPA